MTILAMTRTDSRHLFSEQEGRRGDHSPLLPSSCWSLTSPVAHAADVDVHEVRGGIVPDATDLQRPGGPTQMVEGHAGHADVDGLPHLVEAVRGHAGRRAAPLASPKNMNASSESGLCATVIRVSVIGRPAPQTVYGTAFCRGEHRTHGSESGHRRHGQHRSICVLCAICG